MVIKAFQVISSSAGKIAASFPVVSTELYFELARSHSPPDGRGAQIESPTLTDVDDTDLFSDSAS